jgi:hypothetical protein
VLKFHPKHVTNKNKMKHINVTQVTLHFKRWITNVADWKNTGKWNI